MWLARGPSWRFFEGAGEQPLVRVATAFEAEERKRTQGTPRIPDGLHPNVNPRPNINPNPDPDPNADLQPNPNPSPSPNPNYSPNPNNNPDANASPRPRLLAKI